MSDVEEALAKVSGQHKAALDWFHTNRGRLVPWAQLKANADTGPRLVNQAKGIYKPEYTEYALSIRTTDEGKYPDKAVQYRPDGGWVLEYFQENHDPAERDREATNRGLMQCMRRGVPVGCLIKRTPKPGVQYEVLGLALVTGWNEGYFTLEGFSHAGSQRPADVQTDAALSRSRLGVVKRTTETYDPSNREDLRERSIVEIARRRGQPQFRASLLEAYEGRCCITNCNLVEVLEAAHIAPYLGSHSHHVQNGLLLRADIHTLFDLGLLSISDEYKVLLTPAAASMADYAHLDGYSIQLPSHEGHHPNKDALRHHREWAGFRKTVV